MERKSKRTLEWACEKDEVGRKLLLQEREERWGDEVEREFSAKLSFPTREVVGGGLGFFNPSPQYIEEPASASTMGMGIRMDIDDVQTSGSRPRLSSSWSTTSTGTEESDEMELMTPTGSVGSLGSLAEGLENLENLENLGNGSGRRARNTRMLPEIVVTSPDGREDFCEFQGMGMGGLGSVKGLSKEDEDAATILMQLRHHQRG